MEAEIEHLLSIHNCRIDINPPNSKIEKNSHKFLQQIFCTCGAQKLTKMHFKTGGFKSEECEFFDKQNNNEMKLSTASLRCNQLNQRSKPNQ